MSQNLFTEYQIKELEKNVFPERSITYQPDFKTKAVLEYQKGKIPSQIFIEHGFNLEYIGKKQPRRCLQRWRETYEKFGEVGLQTERRGKASTGRPSPKELSVEEKLKKAELQELNSQKLRMTS